MTGEPSVRLPADVASRFASVALEHVRREYPNKLDHVLRDATDLRSPRSLHPLFYGSFDWHSNVHAYWLLATIHRRTPRGPEQARIERLFDEQFTAANVASEVEYLLQPERGTFERPYGWAWLLMLAAELGRGADARRARWSEALRPLSRAVARRFQEFLPRATYPVRAGTHFNTAFALALTFEYAESVSDGELTSLIRDKSAAWYGNDSDCQAWEPGGDDFLSPALIEAECMRRVLLPEQWQSWIDRFLPRIARREPAALFTPVVVTDRSDGKIAHLDGLNLSRAWCWRAIASSWPPDDPRRGVAVASATSHLAASLPHVSGEYAGEHWLATYALLALLADEGVIGR